MTIEELREKIMWLEHDARTQRDEYRTSRDPCWAHWNGRCVAYCDALGLLDQYIAANKDKELVSSCCGQRAFVAGDVTKHYECTNCGYACDLNHIPDAGKKVEEEFSYKELSASASVDDKTALRFLITQHNWLRREYENLREKVKDMDFAHVQLTERVEKLEQIDESQDSINELLTNRVELIEQWDEKHDFVCERLINRVEKLEQRINKWDIL